MITIKNNDLTAIISDKGAELQSLRANGIEYLWQARPEFWAKHSPVLFPVVGELKNGFYIFDNREYKLSRHGFARDKIFRAEQRSATSAIFTLQSDEETLRVYPFEFILQVEYKIAGNELTCTYHVQNTGDKTMYFSVGGHPAFNVPLNSSLQYEDYYLKFNNDDILKKYRLSNGLISNDTASIRLVNKILPLKKELFYEDAIVLKHIKSNAISLKSDKDPRGLHFTFEHFPYFGIWAAKDAPFVCLEPWCGIADSADHDNLLKKKEGINELAPAAAWKISWSAALF
ncbi:MAG TPA: aldose 1-epimerase family protein [Chitinophagaceae bacterium]|nr:aldose 1-epimerase family protein [Chitinophagaceae bacterium]